MEIIAVINDRVTCLNLIYFLSQKFWLWNPLVLGNPKKRRRCQQIVCPREARLPFWKAVWTSCRWSVLERRLPKQWQGCRCWHLGQHKMLHQPSCEAVTCVTGWELCSDGNMACSFCDTLSIAFLFQHSSGHFSRKSARSKPLRFSWLHLFLSDLADTSSCSALTSLHHVSSHKGLPHNCICSWSCVWICPQHHL